MHVHPMQGNNVEAHASHIGVKGVPPAFIDHDLGYWVRGVDCALDIGLVRHCGVWCGGVRRRTHPVGSFGDSFLLGMDELGSALVGIVMGCKMC